MSSDISSVSNIANVEFSKFTLDELIEKRNQGVNTTTEKVSYSESGFPVIRANNISQGWIDFSDIVYVDKKTFARIKESCKPKKGDILYTNIGSQFGNAAKVSINFQFAIAWNVLRLQPKKNTYSDFLVYLLNNPESKSRIRSLNSSSTMPFVSGTAIGTVQFSVPNFKQQKLIAQTLKILDDRITLLRDTNTTIEALAQALFKSWFVDFDPVRAKQEGREPEGMDADTAALFPDSFEESELGLVPKGWRVGTLNDLAVYQNGYAFKAKDWQDTGYPVVKIGNVKPGVIDISGCSWASEDVVAGLDRFLLNRGDLLVGMTGYVGETGLVPDLLPPAYLNQRVGRISTKAGIADLGFVYCVVRNPQYKTYAEERSHGSAQANVSGSDLMAYPTVLPAAAVLSAFNQVLYSLIDMILSNHAKAQTLASLRDTLLPRLISGQLRLPETELFSEDFMK